MERSTGVVAVTAAEQLQKSHPRTGVQPLPKGSPGRATGADVGIADAKELTFLVIGDHGGVIAPGPQNAVSTAMEKMAAPAFVYSVGDIAYYYGEEEKYAHQFYEPYAHLEAPIVAIPGNHDGDREGAHSTRPPLDAFMANFCDSAPHVPAADPEFEFARHTQTQPYCDWTLALEAVTIVGFYSNVPAGGHLEASQVAWLTGELAAAPTDRPLIVTLHHPPYSVDAMHGGSLHMGEALDGAFAASGRMPDLVLSGHVHDYQRFTRELDGKKIAYVVIGNSGYHNLHHLAKGAKPGDEVGDGVTFEYGDASEYGFLAFTASAGKLAASYTGVHPGTMPDGSDSKATPGKDVFEIPLG
jgi:predicted MPP superfamily phosphohydrolase